MQCSVASDVVDFSDETLRAGDKIGFMCSNYVIWLSKQNLAEEYGVEAEESMDAQLFPYRPTKTGRPAKVYNMAPAIIREDSGRRELLRMRWGLLPHWAMTDQDMPQPFNATVEKVASSPMFKPAFQKRRCLIPASAFFEYGPGETGKRTRYRFGLPGHEHFAFAGIFNVWHDTLHTATFVTTPATEWFSQFHDRQPVTIIRHDYDRWLDPLTPTADLEDILKVWPGELETKAEPKGG